MPRRDGVRWERIEMLPDWRRVLDPRSIRTKFVGRGEKLRRLLIGCPTSHWHPRLGRCDVGTRALARYRRAAANPELLIWNPATQRRPELRAVRPYTWAQVKAPEEQGGGWYLAWITSVTDEGVYARLHPDQPDGPVRFFTKARPIGWGSGDLPGEFSNPHQAVRTLRAEDYLEGSTMRRRNPKIYVRMGRKKMALRRAIGRLWAGYRRKGKSAKAAMRAAQRRVRRLPAYHGSRRVWLTPARSRSRRRYARRGATAGRKYVRYHGKRMSWRGLTRRLGVKGAASYWRRHRKVGAKRRR
jgi:hypothetical protein